MSRSINKIVLVVSMISFLDGKNEKEIVENILSNIETIDRERTVSSFYFLSTIEKEKRVKELVHQAVQFQNKTTENIKKLGAVALKFRETGRNVLDIETMRSRDSVVKGGPSIYIKCWCIFDCFQ